MLPDNPKPTKGYNPRDRIKIAKDNLKRLKVENEKKIESLEAELKRRSDNRFSPDLIAEARRNLQDAENLGKWAIENAQKEIAHLQAEVDEVDAKEKEQHEAIMAVKKEQARAVWLSNGGSEGDFEAAWPKIRESMLIQAVLVETDVAVALEDKRREYASFV